MSDNYGRLVSTFGKTNRLATYNMSFDEALELHLSDWGNDSLDLHDFLVHLFT